MQSFYRYINIIILSLFCFSGVRADNLRVSVLTCSPGNDAYAHFGHTAIRVINYDRKEDIVFNYGCFDYTENMFIYKFIKGETDYMLGAETADFFFYRYRQQGIRVNEQVLNITQTEAESLLQALTVNMRPENVQYRYNYLYDNCTTRARDMIESSLTEEVVYKKAPIRLTARQELHEFLRKAQWLRLGIDLVLGQKLDDKNFDQRHQMFIPSHFEAELDSAFIMAEDGAIRPLVTGNVMVLGPDPDMAEQASVIKPIILIIILSVITILLCIYDFYIKRHVSYWLDIAYALIQGLAGIIVSFLFFFSEHPTVDSNWLVIILNPLYLLYAAYMVYCVIRKKRNILSAVNMSVLCMFSIITMTVSQVFGMTILTMVYTLCIRSIVVYFTEKRSKKVTK